MKFKKHIRAVWVPEKNRMKYYYQSTDRYCPFIGSSTIGANGEFIKSGSLLTFLHLNKALLK